MKQRITYLVKDPDSFAPEKLDIEDGSLTLSGVEAVKEHRLTFSLDELPSVLKKTLRTWRKVHIKWASLNPHTAIPPFTSRVTSGLHVFFEPQKTQPQDQLCEHILKLFGSDLRCSPFQETATTLVHSSDRRPDASLQYYSYLATLTPLVHFIRGSICPASSNSCKEGAESLLGASYLDVDYEPSTSKLIVTALWDSRADATQKHYVPAPTGGETIEIGVLIHEPNPDPEDIAFGGFLTVLGRDTTPKPTRFQTPTRNYPLFSPMTYVTAFAQPTGLHPTLLLSFDSPPVAPNPSCTLHTHLTLPSYLFIDKYQFSDTLFLKSHRLAALRNITGATDLEAPDWVVPQWGSASLFDITIPEDDEEQGTKAQEQWNVSIPMHLRYLPAAPQSHERVPVPWPVVFWACDVEQEMGGNPFDRVNLGYEAAFGPDTRFMHVVPAAEGNGTGQLVQWIDVPVLDTRSTRWVESGTIGVVVIAFLGLCWVLLRGLGRETEGEERKKKQ